MRRSIFTIALAGLFAGFLFSSDASACHKKKACNNTCQTVVAPAPVCAPAPAPVVCEAPAKKKCGGGFKMPKLGCHKNKAAACETVTYAAPTTYAAPATYAAPQSYAAPQTYAAPQSSHQGM